MRKISRSGLIKKIDKAFSRYIRKKYADFGGWCECVTCGKRMPWAEIQCGHWVKRGHAATRWSIDPPNAFPQCAGCNLYAGGRQDEMAAYILKHHGPKAVTELIRLKHTEKKWTMPELRELLERFEEK